MIAYIIKKMGQATCFREREIFQVSYSIQFRRHSIIKKDKRKVLVIAGEAVFLEPFHSYHYRQHIDTFSKRRRSILVRLNYITLNKEKR